jgi:glycerophosphodiester phosphodiesterase
LILAQEIESKFRPFDNLEIEDISSPETEPRKSLEAAPVVHPIASTLATTETNKKGSPRYHHALMCTVNFQIKASTSSPSEYVAIVGERKVLGSYNYLNALPLTRVKNGDDVVVDTNEDLWIGQAPLPAGVPTRYRYIICEGSQVLKWESLPKTRSITPEGKSCVIDDGAFGMIPKNSKSPFPREGEEVLYVQEGWLANQHQIRIRFRECSNSNIVLYDGTKQFKVSISTKQPLTEVHKLTWPRPNENTEISFQGLDIEKLASLQFDISSIAGPLLGRAAVHPSQLIPSRKGVNTVTIMNSSLVPIGEICFEYLIILPFSHPNMSQALKHTFWKATTVIGHRGGGAEVNSKTGKYRRTHIKENTILSFRTAASLGAEYVGMYYSIR